MTNHITPIFIFSLPRSGSTLLQKILLSSNDVSGISEPWFLLPLIYSQKISGSISEYSHFKSYHAILDLKRSLNEKGKEYDDYINLFASSIYKDLSDPNSKYFIDKTPRYYLICSDIIKIFPNSKFIFLFRNPLSIYSSKLNTRRKNKFKYLYSDFIDLNYGPNMLIKEYLKYRDISLKLTYEDLVMNPNKNFNLIEKFLNIKLDYSKIENLSSIKVSGTMGDPNINLNLKNEIQDSSIDKWKDTFNTTYRKIIAKKYLNKIEKEYYEMLEIPKENILNSLKEIKTSHFKNIPQSYLDFCHIIYTQIMVKTKLYLFFPNKKGKFKWISGKYLD